MTVAAAAALAGALNASPGLRLSLSERLSLPGRLAAATGISGMPVPLARGCSPESRAQVRAGGPADLGGRARPHGR